MIRWQYHVVAMGSFRQRERLVASLGALGADGWELVAMYDKSSNWLAGMEKGFAVFKRAVPDGSDPVGPWASATFADDHGARQGFDPDTGLAIS